MKPLSVLLPDKVLEHATEEADELSIEVTSLCGAILSDYFLGNDETQTPPKSSKPPGEPKIQTAKQVTNFDVAAEFPGFSSQSVRFAQRFVDEALKLPGVRVFKKSDNRGIGFEPNFVFVEYLMSLRSGIAVSFYGRPSQHNNSKVGKGRGTSYSRAKIYAQEDLDAVLPSIRKAYELKFGKA